VTIKPVQELWSRLGSVVEISMSAAGDGTGEYAMIFKAIRPPREPTDYETLRDHDAYHLEVHFDEWTHRGCGSLR